MENLRNLLKIKKSVKNIFKKTKPLRTASKILFESKQISWKNFVTLINPSTTSREL